ncbi:unnamed protein product [Mytilus coruscus]|uniref:Integrase zinc-binding domain-containing protein n=1 Tax=Mytilus coruscus TaxID=42192 RepID=A0A6J8E230_MYTCO|nr:unnamed protein product [Mytilus coruscus]
MLSTWKPFSSDNQIEINDKETNTKTALNAVKTRKQTNQENECTVWNMGHTHEKLKELQNKDEDVGPILRWKISGKKSCDIDLQSNSPATRHYYHFRDSLVLQDGLLFRKFEKQNKTGQYLQFLTPEKLKYEVLHSMHDEIISGHLGKRKTTEKLLQRFYWFELREDVRIWIAKCEVCRANKPPSKTARDPLGSMPSGAPWDRLATDIMGPFPVTPRGEQTKWDKNLGCLAGAYRATPNESTILTPNLMLLGREIRLPHEISKGGIPLTHIKENSSNYGEHVQNLRNSLHKAHKVARAHLQRVVQIAGNKYLGDLAYLKESPAPHSFNTTVRDYVPLSHSESAGFWVTKSRGEPVPPVVSLPLSQASHMSNPVSLPPAYHHMSTLSPPTTLASIQPSYHYMPAMTSATLANLPPPAYQHLPNMSSTIPANHFLSQTMSQLQTTTVQSHLPAPSVYPTTTATGQPQQPTTSSALTLQMPSTMPTTTPLFTAEPLDQPSNTPSPSIHSTNTTTCTADLSSYLPIDVDEVNEYEAFSPEICSPTRQVLEREAVATAKDEEVMESILPQLLEQDPPGNCSNLNARHAISNDKKKTDDDSSHKVIQALSNLNKSQQIILQELGHLNKSVTTLSSDISFLRGQFRQQERIINRQQRLLDRLNTVNNLHNRIPRANARTTPYFRTTAKRTQKKQMKSVVVKDS